MDEKNTNPKDAMGIAKVPQSCIPAPVIGELGLAMMEGALKYGRHNYRSVGVRASVYFDAAKRHLDAFWEGEDTDPQSGVHHLVKAMACLAVLRDSMLQKNWVDDRPPPSPEGWQEELNQKAAALLKKYPDPKPAHTSKVSPDTKKATMRYSHLIPKKQSSPGTKEAIVGDRCAICLSYECACPEQHYYCSRCDHTVSADYKSKCDCTRG